MTARTVREGVAMGDVLLVLSAFSIVLALAYPWLTEAWARRRAQDVIAQVEAVRAAAERYRQVKGGWPPDGEPGRAPVELAPFMQADVEMSRRGVSLEWDSWETVTVPDAPATADEPPPTDQPPLPDTLHAPPPVFGKVAGVTVHTTDTHLLGLLFERYGGSRSFVREASWTLLIAAQDTVG